MKVTIEKPKGKGEKSQTSEFMMSQLKALRISKDLSRAEIAERAGLTPNIVTNYEEGRVSMKIEVLEKIALALDVTIKDIIPETEKKTKEEGCSPSIFVDIRRMMHQAYSICYSKPTVDAVTNLLHGIVSIEEEARRNKLK